MHRVGAIALALLLLVSTPEPTAAGVQTQRATSADETVAPQHNDTDSLASFFVSESLFTYDRGLQYCARRGGSLAAIYSADELATARSAISAAGVEKAITSAVSDGAGWSWGGTEKWSESGFPLNTDQVHDQRDGSGHYIYSLHRAENSFVWDADWQNEVHRVLCRATGYAPAPSPAGTIYHGAGNGWCSSDLDSGIGDFDSPDQCWEACVATYGDDIVAVELNGYGGSCYCQSSCDCMADGGDDQMVLTRDWITSLPRSCDDDDHSHNSDADSHRSLDLGRDDEKCSSVACCACDSSIGMTICSDRYDGWNETATCRDGYVPVNMENERGLCQYSCYSPHTAFSTQKPEPVDQGTSGFATPEPSSDLKTPAPVVPDFVVDSFATCEDAGFSNITSESACELVVNALGFAVHVIDAHYLPHGCVLWGKQAFFNTLSTSAPCSDLTKCVCAQPPMGPSDGTFSQKQQDDIKAVAEKIISKDSPASSTMPSALALFAVVIAALAFY